MKIGELTKILDDHWDVLTQSPDPKMEPAMKMLAQHLDNPRSYVTMAGETSSGKSTLINSFLGRKFLSAGARPTTGTVTWIEYGLSNRERLLAINRDATVEELSCEQFHGLSKNPDKNLLRLKAELPETRQGYRGLSVFDTPGFNAIISEHAEVLREFLPESDVVVFPVSYKVGFGSSDQQLMELIGDVRKRFGFFPVILVVNRAPHGADEHDKRIAEIRLHAEDSLHDSVELVIVESSLPTEDGEGTLPETDHLWRKVRGVVFNEKRTEELCWRLREAIRSFFVQRLSEIDTELAAADAGKGAISELEEEKRRFDAQEEASYRVVDKYMKRLELELPKLIKHSAEKLMARVKAEISDANKWTDANSCKVYIFQHVLPFSTTGAVREIEDYLQEVFEQMDAELDEMATLTVRSLVDHAQTFENPKLKNLFESLGARIGQRVAGELASSAIKSVSGVGGAATGVGNLAKMGVKQAGKLIGKTFSRDVYTTIGKLFTKRTIQVMNAAITVVVELGMIAWDANRWQGKLVEKAKETVGKWESEVLSEIGKSMIPGYRESNCQNVAKSFMAIREDIDHEIENARKDHDAVALQKLEDGRRQLASALKMLEA